MRSDILTVTEYSARLGRALRQVGPAVLEGEVQKVQPRPNGMLYFDLTDGESLLSCKVFRRDAAALQHQPRAGDLVQVRVDRPDLYSARGSLSLIVSDVRLAGEGELLRRRAELLARLTAEGLCDSGRLRPLPRMPRAVGVIAGPGSDGLSDVIRALTDRWPPVHIVTCPTLVQGQAAPRQLIDALARLQDHPDVEVIILARGGGSVQDLVCFDDEGLCRALFACELPVVCAIGHTDNNPVCNHVAWPAFTPSRSAELVVPSVGETRREIAAARDRLDAVPRRLQLAGERLGAHAQQLDCAARLEFHATFVRHLAGQLSQGLASALAGHDCGVTQAQGALAAVPHRAARALSSEREALTAADRALARTHEQLTGLAREVHQLAQRVGQGTRRQLADHTRDYSRALARLTREARAGLDRRQARAIEQLQRDAALLIERSRRRLEDARRDTSHQAQVIAARDFRPRGWLLAGNADGRPARSVADLKPDARIDLHLHDGHAQAVVDHTTPDDWSRTR